MAGSKMPEPGHDTATGTDPDAPYVEPGYEDKSFGQAVAQDRELAEELLEEEGGDEEAAARRFEEEATGAPMLRRQQEETAEDGRARR